MWIRSILARTFGDDREFDDLVQEGMLSCIPHLLTPAAELPINKATYLIWRAKRGVLAYLGSTRRGLKPIDRGGKTNSRAPRGDDPALKEPLLLAYLSRSMWTGDRLEWEPRCEDFVPDLIARLDWEQLLVELQSLLTEKQWHYLTQTILAGKPMETWAKEQGMNDINIRNTIQRGLNRYRRAHGLPVTHQSTEHHRKTGRYDALLAKNREWRAAHPEVVKRRNAEYYAANREKELARSREYTKIRKSRAGEKQK
jgi:DNA-directed RNA polymerase specialized sigma24 family protein